MFVFRKLSICLATSPVLTTRSTAVCLAQDGFVRELYEGPYTLKIPERAISTTTALRMSASGSMEVASKDDLKSALANPNTVILDIRSVEEIAETGYWKSETARWAHAPGSREENPLLSTAAKAIVPDTTTPVIVYCARGFRAAKAKEILEAQGYTNVMNAGGYPDDMADL